MCIEAEDFDTALVRNLDGRSSTWDAILEVYSQGLKEDISIKAVHQAVVYMKEKEQEWRFSYHFS